MRVQFTHSQEEIVDALMRLRARSNVVRGMRRKRTFWMALAAAFLVVLLFRFSLKGFLIGAFAALLSVLTDPWLYRYEEKKGARKLVKEKYGEQREFLCTVDLLPEGVKVSSAEVELMFPWETVEEILGTNDSVDIFSRAGICVVRNRAFSSADERQRFINVAQQYADHARSESKQ